MTWLRRFRLAEHMREALWPIPLGCVILAVALTSALPAIDRRVDYARLDWSPGATQTVLSVVAGSMITFTGFVFTMVLMAVQFASVQMTPRLLKSTFRSPTMKLSLGIFIFTFAFSIGVLRSIERDFVPQLSVFLALLATLASLFTFLFLLHDLTTSLRPSSVVVRIGALGRAVIARSFPEPFLEARPATPVDEPTREHARTIRNEGAPGVVLAVDVAGLVRHATRTNSLFVLAPSVGDFVGADAPLFHVFAPGAKVDGALLRRSIALGDERTYEQDPGLAFRVLVDVGCKALSAGINDPTTAVAAIDQIQDLLGRLGARRLGTGQVRDRAGNLRLEMHKPAWEDFVSLALDEIRQYGKGTFQVVRRLRAMLEDLLEIVPDPRRQALREQLALVQRGVDREFVDEEDHARASTGDAQGVGSFRMSGVRRHAKGESNE